MDALKAGRVILLSTFKSLKALKLYPAGHPALQKIIADSYGIILKTLREAGGIRIEVHRNGFTVGGLNPDEEGRFSELADELFIRGVKTFILDSYLSLDDFKKLLIALQMEPEEVLKKGGFGRVLLLMNARGIKVEEMDFLLKVEERTVEKEGRGGKEEEGATVELEVMPEELTSEDREILELINRLKRTYELQTYERILKSLVNKCKELVTMGDFKMLPAVFIALSRIFMDQKREAEIRRITAEAGRSIASEKVIGYLLEKAREIQYSELPEYGNIFLMIGDTSIKYLLEKLFVEESLKGRKFIADIVIRFGRKAIPHLLYYLNDRNWFVVRNCLFILGEIGDPRCVEIISRFATHKDERIKKEAIHALSKIKHPESLSLLLKLLTEVDEKTKPFVVRSLGNIGEKTIEPILYRLMDSPDPAMKKECLLALARLSSHHALYFAKKILQASKLPRDRELIEAALLAIEILGTPEAITVLEGLLFSKSTDLKERTVETLFRMAERIGV